MDEPFPPGDDEPALDRWAVPLDEPAPTNPDPVPPPPVTDEGEPDPPDVLRFGNDPYPSEGYHPRLSRFGDAA